MDRLTIDSSMFLRKGEKIVDMGPVRLCLGCGSTKLLRRADIISDECGDCGMIIDDLVRAKWEFVEKGVVVHRYSGLVARLQPDGKTFKVDT